MNIKQKNQSIRKLLTEAGFRKMDNGRYYIAGDYELRNGEIERSDYVVRNGKIYEHNYYMQGCYNAPAAVREVSIVSDGYSIAIEPVD